MRRTWLLWMAFALCLAVVLAAMGWISRAAVQLDRAEAQARGQAELEENLRLALWRIDSALAPLVAQESARPYFAYNTFLPLDRPYGKRGRGEPLAPSPLLRDLPPPVRAYFQFEPDGRLGSPRAPIGANAQLAVPRYLSPEAAAEARRQLEAIARRTDRQRLRGLLPEHAPPPVETVVPLNWSNNEIRAAQQQPQQQVEQMPQKRVFEYNQRSQAVAQNTAVAVQAVEPALSEAPGTNLEGVRMTPLWVGGELLLARRVVVHGQEYLQGCVLDWPAIRTGLLEKIADLVPGADLVPDDDADAWETHRVAAIPARLVPAEAAGEAPSSPLRLTLAVAWTGVLLAAAAVAALLAGVVRLSGRRAAFVSAVTHELRTPLTTFHLYTEMLAEGMVPDPDRKQYLATLRQEAGRLSHLVENVLAYARLERGRSNGPSERRALGDLVEPSRSRLSERAAQAGMQLVVEPGDAWTATADVNPSAVEQVLFNLVDNACKYAAAADDKRVHLSAGTERRRAWIEVRDHGPGLTPRRSLFRPFSKSAGEAANSAPGVGLGLALSRRLARQMGGRLRVQSSSSGAVFRLEWPLR